MRIKSIAITVIVMLVMMGCTGYKEKTKDIVMTVDLVQDSALVNRYLQYHAKVWPEVEAGFKKAGYRRIRMYRFDHHLVMIITVPENADLAALGKTAEASDPRCKEWNELMDKFQQGVSGTAVGQKWVEMEKMYEFDNK